MNFRNSEILSFRCLEGRQSYQKVESVSKSDEKWIYYSDFKKDVSSWSGPLATWKWNFPIWSIFDLESRTRYQIVQFDEQEGFVKSKLISLRKTTELTHGNRLSPKNVSIIIFMRRKFVSRKTFARHCCRARRRAIQEWKAISKSVHIWRFYGRKTGEISTINVTLGIKTTFFDCGGQ